ncbi:MAG: AMP-binding protein, partial [Bacteroidia bacterium]|nr:AMP-binding protein [Bacteroidia bacterium]
MKELKTIDFKTIGQFWETIVKSNVGEEVFLQQITANSTITFTFKEVNAWANCLAAYFLKNGIRKCDCILVLSESHPYCFLYDLAIQFTGGINITLPADLAPNDFIKITQQVNSRFLLIPSLDLYRKWKNVLSQTSLICLCFAPDEELLEETDKVVTLDTAILIGKEYWREEQKFVSETKQAVKPTDISCIVWNPDNQ